MKSEVRADRTMTKKIRMRGHPWLIPQSRKYAGESKENVRKEFAVKAIRTGPVEPWEGLCDKGEQLQDADRWSQRLGTSPKIESEMNSGRMWKFGKAWKNIEWRVKRAVGPEDVC